MTESCLKRADNVVYREIDDEIVILKYDKQAVHVLNKTAARIWEMCNGDLAPDEIAAKLCERYDVSPERASNDVRNAIAKMTEMGLLIRPD
jgi:hypothetical protein